ncbi:MAG: hypothetical protein HY998_05230 [candidate division NC10 bacterium]|nr:hypothetical protein [candidate division NC10 bacterium]
MFSEDIQLLVTSDETDEGDCPIRNVVNFRQLEAWRGQDWNVSSLFDKLERCFTFKAAITVIPVMEELEVL